MLTDKSKQRRERGIGVGGGWGGELGVIGHEFEVKNIGGSNSIVNDRASTTVVVHISLLLEKTNGRALAGVNDGDARFRNAGSVHFPHAIKLGDVIISFLQHLLRAIEASAIDNDGLWKVAIVRRCIGTHGAVEK